MSLLLERLPEDILGQILSEVVFLKDYIKFGAVCKIFYNVFLQRKRHRIEQCNNEVPLMFIPIFTHSNEVIDSSFTNNNTNIIVPSPNQIFNVALDQGCYTSLSVSPMVNTSNLKKTSIVERTFVTSYCYLVTVIKEKSNIILNLSNPITGHTISLPTIPDEDIPVWRLYMVVFSCNPCIYPDKCVVAYLSTSSIGFTRLGSNKWTKFSETKREWIMLILFHKGQLHALHRNSNLFIIDCIWESGNGDNCDFQTCDVVGTGKDPLTCEGYGPYMVESLRGELLMIVVVLGGIKVYKLVITNDDGNKKKGHWDQIHRLGNGDEALFLSGPRNTTCSKCRSLESDSVYHLKRPYETDSGGISHEVLVVSLDEERKGSAITVFDDILGKGLKPLVPYWINPILH